MILAAAVVLGLAVALVRYGRRGFTRIAAMPLRWAWLALLALALQVPILRAPAGPADGFFLQRTLLLTSYLLLLLFVLINRRQAALLIVGLGVLCNLAVILANQEYMPITPQTLVAINPGSAVQQWQVGTHYGYSKDIILTRGETHLWPLSDLLVIPPPFPWPTAFSIGDLFLAAGIVVLLAAPGFIIERRVS